MRRRKDVHLMFLSRAVLRRILMSRPSALSLIRLSRSLCVLISSPAAMASALSRRVTSSVSSRLLSSSSSSSSSDSVASNW